LEEDQLVYMEIAGMKLSGLLDGGARVMAGAGILDPGEGEVRMEWAVFGWETDGRERQFEVLLASEQFRRWGWQADPEYAGRTARREAAGTGHCKIEGDMLPGDVSGGLDGLGDDGVGHLAEELDRQMDLLAARPAHSKGLRPKTFLEGCQLSMDGLG
jgi:hypothetical protein